MQYIKELINLTRFGLDEIVSPEGVVVLIVVLGSIVLPVNLRFEIFQTGLGLSGGAAYGYVKRGRKDSEESNTAPIPSTSLPDYEDNM